MNHINPNLKKLKKQSFDIDAIQKGILNGNRTALSRAITLVESNKPSDRLKALELLNWAALQKSNSIRVGITGVPGAGKSTLIESLGSFLINKGNKVAVLAIDPSSQKSKGSILGDKTRMEELSKNQHAFIRPTAAGKHLGGVAGKTKESMALCEAAGFNIILIETVGVGQSEVAVKSMVDFFLLVLVAGAGDELQGIKRGIMEMADMILINKAEAENKIRAQASKIEYTRALSLFNKAESGWKPKVATCSAIHHIGIEEAWKNISQYISTTNQNGYFSKTRIEQNKLWFEKTVKNGLLEQLMADKNLKSRLERTAITVNQAQQDPIAAAYQLLNSISINIHAT
ncbi:MAG: methylmalonyl Co-A mutase-associated GTPase MeaB [Bacteroidia bacterium]